MKNNNTDCITNLQWLCKTWRRTGFKVIHVKPNQLRRRREVSENSYVNEEYARSLYTHNPLEFITACEEPTLESLRDLCRGDPKHLELQNELYDESKKALRQYWFSLDLKKASKCARPTCRYPGTLRTSFQFTMWKSIWSRSYNLSKSHQETKVECISSARKSFLEDSWDTPWTRRSWTGHLLIVDTEFT